LSLCGLDVVDQHRLADVHRDDQIEPAQLDVALPRDLRPRDRDRDQRERRAGDQRLREAPPRRRRRDHAPEHRQLAEAARQLRARPAIVRPQCHGQREDERRAAERDDRTREAHAQDHGSLRSRVRDKICSSSSSASAASANPTNNC
jgi:hypothetical protein